MNWERDGITTASRDHVKYMEKLSRDFRQTIIHRMDKLMADDNMKNSHKMAVYQEVAPHVNFCQER